MLKTIKFRNFRGFRSVELRDLSQITLLTGKNSSGKSSVLEGIFLLMGNGVPETFEKIRVLRGLLPATEVTKLWEPLFYQMDVSQVMDIEAQYNQHHLHLAFVRDDSFAVGESKQNTYNSFVTYTSISALEYALNYSFSVDNENITGHLFMNENKALSMEAGQVLSRILKEKLQGKCLLMKAVNGSAIDDAVLADSFCKLDLAGKQQIIIEMLRIINPSVTEIKTIVQNGLVQLYFRIGSLMIPVKLSGDGMCKLLYLIMMILQNPGGIILIDEIENGFHYSMQEDFWRILVETALRSNTQIIATTHSYECIQHAVDGIEKAGMLKEFSLQRLEHIGGECRTIRYDGELLKDAVLSEMEVR